MSRLKKYKTMTDAMFRFPRDMKTPAELELEAKAASASAAAAAASASAPKANADANSMGSGKGSLLHFNRLRSLVHVNEVFERDQKSEIRGRRK